MRPKEINLLEDSTLTADNVFMETITQAITQHLNEKYEGRVSDYFIEIKVKNIKWEN